MISKSDVPKSVEFLEDMGIVVREFKELPSYDAEMDLIIKDYMVDAFRVGAASDIARLVVMNEEGGLYVDLDIALNKYDNRLHYLFDLVAFYSKEPGMNETVNGIFLAKKNHTVIREY